jgi:hypothetical protein
MPQNPTVEEYYSQIANQGGGATQDYTGTQPSTPAVNENLSNLPTFSVTKTENLPKETTLSGVFPPATETTFRRFPSPAREPIATVPSEVPTTLNTPPEAPDTQVEQPLPVIGSVTGTAKSTHKVKISLPLKAKNFYNDTSNQLLLPLKNTEGFLFPIQPAITTGFDAKYQDLSPTHSNFPYQMYQNSSMKSISLTGDFVIRNQYDAQYVTAGIHFLRSLTRMFNYRDGIYAGAPPQVVRLHGLGFTAFDNIPCVLTDVTINFPDNVDYITFQINKKSSEFGSETARMPINLTIQVSLTPVFSRDFITNIYSTTSFSTGAVRLMGQREERQKNLAKSSAEETNSVPNTNAIGVDKQKQNISNAVKGIGQNTQSTLLPKITGSPSTGLAKLNTKSPGFLPNVGPNIGVTGLNSVTNQPLSKLISVPGQQPGIAKALGKGVNVVGR